MCKWPALSLPKGEDVEMCRWPALSLLKGADAGAKRQFRAFGMKMACPEPPVLSLSKYAEGLRCWRVAAVLRLQDEDVTVRKCDALKLTHCRG